MALKNIPPAKTGGNYFLNFKKPLNLCHSKPLSLKKGNLESQQLRTLAP